VQIEFDPAKSERNLRERGLSFERAADFDFETAVYLEDDRCSYGERRFRALGISEAACTRWSTPCAAKHCA
jgi:uncharacterized protein